MYMYMYRRIVGWHTFWLWNFKTLITLLNAKCIHACMLTQLLHHSHDLDIVCNNVLISHNSTMHAYACCTFNLISPCTK